MERRPWKDQMGALGAGAAAAIRGLSGILHPDCENDFIDRKDVAPITVLYLKGIAAALHEVQGKCSRLNETFVRVRDLGQPRSTNMLLAGGAFAAAKLIPRLLPGPRILLFAAALDAYFDHPQVELTDRIIRLKKEMKKGIAWDDRLTEVFEAAKNFAKSDKINEKLRTRFAQGLSRSQKYVEEEIDDIAWEIAETAARVRHDARTNSQVWTFNFPPCAAGSEFDPFATASEDANTPNGHVVMSGQDAMLRLADAAMIGCAHALASDLC